MQSKSLIVAAFVLGLGAVAGCDSPEVEDKISSILVNGLIEGEVKCSGQWFVGTTDGAGASPPAPDSGTPIYNDFTYRAQKLQDGTCFMAWSESSNIPSVIEFIPLHDPKHTNCEVGTLGGIVAEDGEVVLTSTAHSARYVSGPRNNFTSWEYYLPSPAPTTVFDMNTQCTGFNFGVFDSP